MQLTFLKLDLILSLGTTMLVGLLVVIKIELVMGEAFTRARKR